MITKLESASRGAFFIYKHNKKNKGFTLIELMIVVLIIGVLSSLAMPAYQDYLVRAKITEGLTHATSAKTFVSENALSGSSNLSLGYVSPVNNDIVDSVSINSTNGQITVTFDTKIGGATDTMIFIPTAGGVAISAGSIPANEIEWDCSQGTLNSRYRPAYCR